MPPIIALSLTWIFIIFLLRLDRKQNPTAPFALWIPTLWMLLINSKAIAIWFGGSDSGSAEEGSILNSVFIGALFIIGLLILIKRRFNWANGIKNNILLIVLIVFMLLSVFWSDMAFVSFKRWLRYAAVATVMAFVAATENDPRQALKTIFRRIIYIQIPLSITLIKYFPDLGVQYSSTGGYMWVGVSSQKNGLALRAIFAIFYLFWIRSRRWRMLDTPVTGYQGYVEVLLLMLAIYLFMGPEHTLTYSATSLACLVIGLTTLLSLLWLKRRNVILSANSLSVVIAFIILFGTITPFLGELPIDVSGVLQRDSTLTGRADIWAKLIPDAEQKLLLGYGFGGFWTDEKIMKTFGVNEAHNGYLDTILNIGIVGLMLMSLFLISLCRSAQKEMEQHYDWGIFGFSLILMLVVHNVTESTLYMLGGLMPMIIFLHVSLRLNGLRTTDP